MSIINEALKKASKSSEKEQDWFKTVLEPFETKSIQKAEKQDKISSLNLPKHPKRSTWSKVRVFLAAFFLLILLCGLPFGYYFMNLNLGNAQKVQSIASIQKVAIKPDQISFAVPFFALHAVKEKKEEKKETVAGSHTLSSSLEKPKSESIPKKMPRVELTGIMMENPPQALINGRFLKVGAKFKGVKIIQIVSNSVTFEYQGRKFKKWLD